MRDDLQLKNNLKSLRTAKKMTQEELAYLVGTTRQTIVAIEKGQFNPTSKLALLLCTALDCKFEEMFYF